MMPVLHARVVLMPIDACDIILRGLFETRLPSISGFLLQQRCTK